MEGDFSSIKLLEKVVQLALPTQFISNEIAGVLETLESWKRQYNPQLEGILVNYSNVSLLSRSNKVIISRNGIIIDVKAIFHLFCPKAGDVVKGKINRISREFVGCIMHETINATIYLTEYYPDELKKFIKLERNILFEITNFSCFRSEVRVKGKISSHCVSLMAELFPDVEEEALTNFSFQNENTITHYDFPTDIEECQMFKSEIIADVPIVNVVNSPTDLKDEQKSVVTHKKSKKRILDASPSEKSSKKKQKKDIISPESSNLNGDSALLKDELDFKQELKSNDEINFNSYSQSLKTLDQVEKHLKKKKKQKTEKKKSKKSTVIATGTIVKSDKKKLNKKKHSKKDGNKKKDKKTKTKKGHKKDKRKKLIDNLPEIMYK